MNAIDTKSSGSSLSLAKAEMSVFVGDCLEVMRRLPDASVDLVFADPPYNLQLSGAVLTRPDETAVSAVLEDWDKFDTFRAYDMFTQAWLEEARRLLKPDGTIWVIGSYHNIYRVGTILQNTGFWMLNDIIWRKTNPMPNFRGRRFTNAHEILLWAARDAKSRYTFNYESMKTLNDDIQMRSDWLLPICNGGERIKDQGNKAHPTQKPEALLARVLMASTNPGDLVLDPFFGTGTTGAVAKKLHRRFIGIEREESYAAIARNRIRKVRPIEEVEMLAAPSRRAQAKIPFGTLLEQGMIKPGETLICAKGKLKARVRADGSLIEDAPSTLPRQGSIHSLGAKLQGRETCNGWAFWHLKRGKQIIPIDDLRAEMRLKLGET